MNVLPLTFYYTDRLNSYCYISTPSLTYSTDVALPASAVEPPPPIESPAPFLSTRGFSLSNMLRSNDPSMQTGINNGTVILIVIVH